MSALQQELDLPNFRKHLTYFTAFSEGWGLYSESLGRDMGVYNTPARRMGERRGRRGTSRVSIAAISASSGLCVSGSIGVSGE